MWIAKLEIKLNAFKLQGGCRSVCKMMEQFNAELKCQSDGQAWNIEDGKHSTEFDRLKIYVDMAFEKEYILR
jgi:hypothetical protein